MRIAYKKINHREVALNKYGFYIVIGIQRRGEGDSDNRYIIENDNGQLMSYSSDLFEVINHKYSSYWIENEEKAIMPREISYKTFWEDFYNDEQVAIQVLSEVKSKIYLEELTTEEVKQIIRDKDERYIYLVIKALSMLPDKQYVGDIIEYCHCFLDDYKKEVSIKDAFLYLSNFKESKVEDLFVKYLLNSEVEIEEATAIVNKYFE